MSSIQELREKRTAKAREYRNLLDSHTGAIPEEAGKQLDTLESEISALDDAIARHEKALAMEADRLTGDPRDERENAPHALYDKWMRGGPQALTPDDWAAVRNTMSTGTDAQGGYTVPTEVSGTIIEALKAFGGMRSVATVISTATGVPMTMPTSDGTTEEGEILGENTAAAAAAPSFGVVNLGVHKYSSKTVAVPIELLQDSNADIEAFVNNRLITRLGRITNKHFTVGTGSSQPSGVLTGATLGVTGAKAQVDSVTYDDLVELEHSLDPAYREGGRCSFMFADTTLKAIKKLKDGQGRPLWLPGIDVKEPASILGYRYVINQSVPAMAATAKSVLFGDFSKYIIRDAMGITMYRFADSAFAQKGQVGFLAFMRSGGVLTDAQAVKFFQHGAAA